MIDKTLIEPAPEGSVSKELAGRREWLLKRLTLGRDAALREEFFDQIGNFEFKLLHESGGWHWDGGEGQLVLLRDFDERRAG
jgi:hypothetical protein